MLKFQPVRLVLERCQSPIVIAPCRLPAAPLRRYYSGPNNKAFDLARGYRPALYQSMRRREVETSPPAQAHKKRRLSFSTHEAMSQTTQAQTSGQTLQTLPSVQLTPIENTLKELLLDVAQYIREQTIAKGGSEDLPQTELRFTGGWVRDKLLGVDSHDIDVGISTMTGYQFGMALKEYLDIPENLDKYKKNHPDGELSDAIVSLHKIGANPEKSKHLETVATKIFGLEIDLVNLRKETYSEDSRNPQMEFGTAEEDAMRRDATINALFYNLNKSKVEDFTGLGWTDMQNKIIRTPMEPFQTFKDDPLRVLRLIRFASRLGYQIHEDTEKAMQNEEIREALKLKISKERVGTELDKMLRGPDPRGALNSIDRIGLYSTIFANHQDDACADTSSWALAYNTLGRLLNPNNEINKTNKIIFERVLNTLIRDKTETYYAWVIAAFAPWTNVPPRIAKGKKAKPHPPRASEVARDSLRSDNKTMAMLRDASNNWESIIDVKSSLLGDRMTGTAAEARQHIGLQIRAWNKEWRLCFMTSILQEIMGGRDVYQVFQEYDAFLKYIVKESLDGACEMKPIVNGGEIMQGVGASSGPWLGKAMDMVVNWQLLHPEVTDKKHILAVLDSRREELGLPPA